MMKYLTFIAITLVLAVNCMACNCAKEPPVMDLKPEVAGVSIGPGLFRSEKYYLEVQLPDGWAAVEGPEFLMMHLEGQVAFNSWGQQDFWVRETREEHTDGSVSYTYGKPRDVMSQIPEGGASVLLLRLTGPPPADDYVTPPDTVAGDLGGLWQPHDWRQDSETGAQLKELFKYGRWLQMWVACRPDASDETVAALNDLLESWRFDTVPVADIDSALKQARSILPEESKPWEFYVWEGSKVNERFSHALYTQAREDALRFWFIYRWNITDSQDYNPRDCPEDSCHWWKIDVLPTGEAVLIAEGGAGLPDE